MDLTRHHWGSDVPVSRPVANEELPSLVDFGGFGFGEGGLTVNATPQEIEEVFVPHFAPHHTVQELFDGREP